MSEAIPRIETPSIRQVVKGWRRIPAASSHTSVVHPSIYQPMFMGLDNAGRSVDVVLAYRNMLIGGEPGAGKSVALNNIVAHAALSPDVDLILIDGKLVELLPWARAASVFVGSNVNQALRVLAAAVEDMERRYALLASQGRRKIVPADGFRATLLAVDEIAYFSASSGTQKTREEFVLLLRDLVARGRAVGIIVIAATQRPSADIIPTSLRDLFAYRLAFRCTTDSSSDIVLGQGWASQGYTARDILPTQRGVGLLLAEGGTPRKIKTAYLTDDQIDALARRALWNTQPSKE
jgi:DNA segregation ATPase FtsK/SpoIIIE, S-DNA-T family